VTSEEVLGQSPAFSDTAFLTASGCGTCSVINKAQLALPETSVQAATAKLLDKASGSGYSITLTVDGRIVREQDLVQAEHVAVMNRYGKLSSELYNELPWLAPNDLVLVWIWEAIPNEVTPTRNQLLTSPTLLTAYQQGLKAKLNQASSNIKAVLAQDSTAVVKRGGTESPLVVASVQAASIPRLAQLENVAKIGIYNPGKPSSYTWYEADNLPYAHLYNSGSGSSVCISESDQPDDYSHLSVAAIENPGGATGAHSRWCAGILKAADNYSTAPGASEYIENWGSDLADQWCANQNGVAISMSWSFDDAPGPAGGSDWHADWVSYALYPYPLFIASAGNSNSAGHDTVGNRYYNGIVCAAFDDKGTITRSDDTIASFSSWRNPVTTHMDHELPNLSGPGVNIDGAGLTMSGTSAVPPQVAGTVAMMVARDGVFRFWPELQRATLMATATYRMDEGILTGLSSGMTDQKGGSGALDSFYAVNLANPQYYNDPPQRGFYGRLVKGMTFASDFDSNDIWTVTFGTNAMSNGSSRLRGVIAWDATPGGCDSSGFNCTGSQLDADLDLWVYDDTAGTLVATSSTFDNSWEMVDIPATYGHQYTFKVKKYATYNTFTYIGVAWHTYSQ
jgi:hypothetical protein